MIDNSNNDDQLWQLAPKKICTHHRHTSSNDEDLDHYLTTQLNSINVDNANMPPRGQKPLLNPAAAEFVPGQSSQPSESPHFIRTARIAFLTLK